MLENNGSLNYTLVFERLIICFLCVPTENKSKRELIRMLVQKGYESDPVAAWVKAQEKVQFMLSLLWQKNILIMFTSKDHLFSFRVI